MYLELLMQTGRAFSHNYSQNSTLQLGIPKPFYTESAFFHSCRAVRWLRSRYLWMSQETDCLEKDGWCQPETIDKCRVLVTAHVTSSALQASTVTGYKVHFVGIASCPLMHYCYFLFSIVSNCHKSVTAHAACTGWVKKSRPPTSFIDIFAWAQSFCIKFCTFIGNIYRIQHLVKWRWFYYEHPSFL